MTREWKIKVHRFKIRGRNRLNNRLINFCAVDVAALELRIRLFHNSILQKRYYFLSIDDYLQLKEWTCWTHCACEDTIKYFLIKVLEHLLCYVHCNKNFIICNANVFIINSFNLAIISQNRFLFILCLS